jgi:hypothetical protein
MIKIFQEIPRTMELVLWIEFRTDRLGLFLLHENAVVIIKAIFAT